MKKQGKSVKPKKTSIIGLTETIKIMGNNVCKKLVARIDTGATIGSIDQDLAKELKLGKTVKKKLVKSSHGNSLRPVKKMRFELAGRKFNMNFTIADRDHLKYKVLIGQNVLKKGFLINPNKK